MVKIRRAHDADDPNDQMSPSVKCLMGGCLNSALCGFCFCFLLFVVVAELNVRTSPSINKTQKTASIPFPTPGANPGRDGLATKDLKIGSKNIMSLNYYEYLLNCEAPGGTMKGAIIIRNEPRRIQSKVE